MEGFRPILQLDPTVLSNGRLEYGGDDDDDDQGDHGAESAAAADGPGSSNGSSGLRRRRGSTHWTPATYPASSSSSIQSFRFLPIGTTNTISTAPRGLAESSDGNGNGNGNGNSSFRPLSLFIPDLTATTLGQVGSGSNSAGGRAGERWHAGAEGVMNTSHQQYRLRPIHDSHHNLNSSSGNARDHRTATSPHRSRSTRRRRLFANLTGNSAITSPPSSSDNTRPYNRNVVPRLYIGDPGEQSPHWISTSTSSSTPATAMLSTSPRLELPEHSLVSFKRSFEDATSPAPPPSNGEDRPPISYFSSTVGAAAAGGSASALSRAWPIAQHSETPDSTASAGGGGGVSGSEISGTPSGGSSALFSTSNESAHSRTTVENSPSQHRYAITSSTQRQELPMPSFDTIMPESWLGFYDRSRTHHVQQAFAETDRTCPITASAAAAAASALASTSSSSSSLPATSLSLSHSPPTPPETGARVKRRRSRSAHSSSSFAPSSSSYSLNDHDEGISSFPDTEHAIPPSFFSPGPSPLDTNMWDDFSDFHELGSGPSDSNVQSLSLPPLDLDIIPNGTLQIATPIATSNDEMHEHRRDGDNGYDFPPTATIAPSVPGSPREVENEPDFTESDMWAMALDELDAPFDLAEETPASDLRLSEYIDAVLARGTSSHTAQAEPGAAIAQAVPRQSSPPAQPPQLQVPAGPVASPGPVSARRGLVRQFSLGTLPLFHFEEEGTEEQDLIDFEEQDLIDLSSSRASSASRSSSAGAGATLATADLATGNHSMPSSLSAAAVADHQRQQPRGRRPNLQRNTTAVSPPEESPLNTPEEDERTANDFSIYPGLRQSAGHPYSLPFASFNPARQIRHTSFTADRAPRLSLDLGLFATEGGGDGLGEETSEGERRGGSGIASIAGPVSGHASATARASTVASGSHIPSEVRNAGAYRGAGRAVDVASAADSGVIGLSTLSNSGGRSSPLSSASSSATLPLWRWDAETQRAEVLSDQLERGRIIAAEVQNLQTRHSASPLSAYYPDDNYHTATSPSRALSYTANSSSRVPTTAFTRLSPSVSRPHISPLSAQGSTSRAATTSASPARRALWGEVMAQQPPYRSSLLPSYTSISSLSAAIDMPSAESVSSVSNHSQPIFNRRPGALGNSNLRGPTRGSNEAWMRSQGIDFYDSMSSRATAASSAALAGGNNRSSVNYPAPAATSRPHIPSFRRTTPTPVSSEPPSPELGSGPIPQNPPSSPVLGSGLSSDAWQHRRSDTPATRSLSAREERSTSSSNASNIFSERVGRPSTSADPNGQRGRSVTTEEGATARFRPLSQPERPRRSSRPQLEAIRPISPILLRQPEPAPSSAVRRRENTMASEPGDLPHPLSASLNGDRSPMSWLQDGSNASTSHTTLAITPDNVMGSTAAASPGSSISEWFRWQTHTAPPPRSTDGHDISSGSPPTAANGGAQAAAMEVGEAGEEIAAAARRLDNVRRLLDEVEQNTQRRRRTYGVASSDAPSRSPRSMAVPTITRRNGVETLSREPFTHNTSRLPYFSSRRSSTGLTSALPTIRSSPVSAFSRTDRAQQAGGTSGERLALPLRTRPYHRETYETARPTLQPFDEIFAEVEAEFSQRDRTRSLGDRGGTPLRAASRNLPRSSATNSAATEETHASLLDGQSGLDPATASMETIQNELSRLRRRLQRDRSPGGPDASTSHASRTQETYGIHTRPHHIPNIDWEWFDINGNTNANGEQSRNGGERVPLPPFLLRSLRARRQATFGHIEGLSDIASEPGNYMSDFDFDFSYEGLLALSERLGEVKHRGATAAALSTGLDTFLYVKTEPSGGLSSDGETRCAICLEDYVDQDPCARSTKCGHALHEACLTEWLTRNVTCPICRQVAV